MKKIEDWTGVDRAVFENEILPANQPVVFRDLLRSWPSVQAGRKSRTSVVDYFKQFDQGGAVNAIVGPPEIKGRFFYSENYQDFNFGPRRISIGTALGSLLCAREAVKRMSTRRGGTGGGGGQAEPTTEPACGWKSWRCS